MSLKLDGPDRKELATILLDAFDRADFELALAQATPARKLEDLVKEGPFSNQISELIARAEAEGWLEDLLALLESERGRRPDLLAKVGEIRQRAEERFARPRNEPPETAEPQTQPDPAAPGRPLWKHPGVVGPVVAALLGLAGVVYMQVSKEPDQTPPRKPLLEDPRIDDGSTDPPRLAIDYSGANDDIGLKEVRLWYRFTEQGDWLETEEAWTSVSGTLGFAALDDSGNYYFDAISTDTSGKHSHDPSGTNGQKRYVYFRAEDRNDVSKVVEVLRESTDDNEGDLSERLASYIAEQKVLIEENPAVAAQFESALQRAPQFSTSSVDGPRRDLVLPSLTAENRNRLASIEISVRFIVIHDGETDLVSEERIDNQIRVLNQSFRPGGIRFRHAATRRVENAAWARMKAGSSVELEAKAALQERPESILNVYVVNPPSRRLGWSTFPENLSEERQKDGVVVGHTTLPGGRAPFDQGKTLVHAVGHWLGLFHTFQGGCDGVDDRVDDTVAHAGPNFGHPREGEQNNACDPNEQAPIHNFMNYVDDESADHFTRGQFRRMKESIAAYRRQLLAAS